MSDRTFARAWGCLLGLLVLALCGCALGSYWTKPRIPIDMPPIPAPLAPPVEIPAGADPVQTLKDREAALVGELAGVRAQLDTAEKDARERPIRLASLWLAGIGALAAIAGIVGVILTYAWKLPLLRRTAWAVAACGVAAVIVSQVLVKVLPWLVWTGLAALVLVALAGAAMGLLWVRKLWLSGQLSARGHQAAATALSRLDAETAKQLDLAHLNIQRDVGGDGVINIIDHWLHGKVIDHNAEIA